MADIKGPFWDGKRYQFAIPTRIDEMYPLGLALSGEPAEDADRMRVLRAKAAEIVAICDRIEEDL